MDFRFCLAFCFAMGEGGLNWVPFLGKLIVFNSWLLVCCEAKKYYNYNGISSTVACRLLCVLVSTSSEITWI